MTYILATFQNAKVYRWFATIVSQPKMCDFWGGTLRCYNFLWVQLRHNRSPAASFANCIMTLYLLKVHLQTFLFIPITQKCQILSCDTLLANERYTGCPRRNVPDFGRVFLMLKYTDIIQNTYIQSWTVTEIMAREVWNFDNCYTLIDYQIHIKTGRNMWFL